MLNIQIFFNNKFLKNSKQIFLEGNEIKSELEGKELIIDNYKNLKYLYLSDLPQLTKLTIKDCSELGSLELHLDKEIEVILIGNFPKLQNIKNISTQPQPIILKNDCQCEGKRIFFEAILVFLNLMLMGYAIYAYRRRKR